MRGIGWQFLSRSSHGAIKSFATFSIQLGRYSSWINSFRHIDHFKQPHYYKFKESTQMSYIPPPTTLPTGSKVWAYLRDSGGESQEQSTVQQRSEIEAYCKEYGLILVQVFEDIARSGGTSNGRIEFLDTIEKSNLPEHAEGLLVWNYARFARDMDYSAFYRALLRKNRMIVHSLTDPIPAGEFSRVIESLIDYANEEKRHQNSRDVKRALAERLRAGYSPGGKPPRGYLPKQEI